SMSIGFWLKKCFIFCSIATQHQNIVYANKVEVDQSILCFPLSETSADQVRNRIHFIMVHDRRANTYCSRSFSNLYLFENAICFLLKHMFCPVISHIYIGRLEFHQWIKMIKYGINGLAF